MIKNILYTALTVIALFLVLVNVPVSLLSTDYWFGERQLGLTYTTLTGTESLSNFPTLWNATLSNIDSEVFELSQWYATTSATQISTLGTITTGTWQGTVIDEVYGGTGLSSYSTGDILYASGANTLSRLAASSTNEVLTLDASGVPVWRDAVVNEANNYDWTGIHTWTKDTTFNGKGTATSTFNRGVDIDADATTPLILRAISYIFPSAGGSANQILISDGGTPQTLSWANETARNLDSDWQTPLTISGTSVASTSVLTIAIPANTLDSDTSVRFAGGTTGTSGVACRGAWQIGNGSSTSTLDVGTFQNTPTVTYGSVFATSTSNTTITAQKTASKGALGTHTSGYIDGGYATNALIYLSFEVSMSGGPATCGLAGYESRIIGR